MLQHESEFHSFLRQNNIPLCVCFLIHLSVNQQFGCCHLSAVMNISVQVTVQSLLLLFIEGYKAMPKNAQTAAQLHSSHMLVK